MSNAPQFFVDAAQGRGKTTLAKRIVARMRAKGAVVLIAATTGLAALNYEGASTAHSLFKIPVPEGKDDEDDLVCGISKTQQRADLLKAADLIIWDEFPMTRVHCADAVDRLLSDLMDGDERPSARRACD